jgi:hypothetical protein
MMASPVSPDGAGEVGGVVTAASAAAAPEAGGVVGLVRRHPLTSFWVLACALSWWPGLLYLFGASPVPMAGFGPFLAAVVVLALDPRGAAGHGPAVPHPLLFLYPSHIPYSSHFILPSPPFSPIFLIPLLSSPPLPPYFPFPPTLHYITNTPFHFLYYLLLLILTSSFFNTYPYLQTLTYPQKTQISNIH